MFGYNQQFLKIDRHVDELINEIEFQYADADNYFDPDSDLESFFTDPAEMDFESW